MLLADLQKQAVAALSALYPAQEARSIVLMLCEALFGTNSYTSIVDPGYGVKDTAAFDKAMERLSAGEPIQYVLGRCTFGALTFRVTPDVLIPRPETELLCREAVNVASRIQRMRKAYGKAAEPVRILDLCTGSGCIAWTLALSVPGVKVVGVDISEGALAVARSQDFKTMLKEKGAQAPVFVQADVLDAEQDFAYGPFDLLLANPPYICESERSEMRRNVLDYEPALALFVPDDDPLRFYRAIARWSDRFLTQEGGGMVEINESFGPQTAEVMRRAGFSGVEVRHDLAEKPRFVTYRR